MNIFLFKLKYSIIYKFLFKYEDYIAYKQNFKILYKKIKIHNK